MSPLAELTSMLHVLAEPGHHPALSGWAAATLAGLKPALADRLLEAEFLWRSSRADFLVPGRPGPDLTAELDAVDRLGDEVYVAAALVTTCSRHYCGEGGPLTGTHSLPSNSQETLQFHWRTPCNVPPCSPPRWPPSPPPPVSPGSPPPLPRPRPW
ncbi:hypothetical protein GCM10007977_071440 [Dactylosporangium sucinum]|uniref:DUF5937 domain-containing protein n=1 Tax=Dactylosporangium sucinum TaxID=1424081 RepID=A0A917U5X6_9ACTN|nr:hypothetical protein GCM10007977_071440 [Dactylosporangium sucinum]